MKYTFYCATIRRAGWWLSLLLAGRGWVGLGLLGLLAGTGRVQAQTLSLAASAYDHNLLVRADGTLWAWGINSYYQLGDGTQQTRLQPVQVGTATNWASVSASEKESLGLRTDGTLWAWGQHATLPSTTLTPLQVLGPGPLPVVLTAFTATAAGPAAVRLAWATASESNSARFQVERSPDGLSFDQIGTVAAAGSSSAPRQYAWLDATLPAGATGAYYRLRQVDQDGTAAYSPVRHLALAGSGGAARLRIFPNPAPGAATLAGAPAGAVLHVLDARGRLVASALADAAGTALLPAGLAPGVYAVRAAGGTVARWLVE